jgi:hypothetical protein
MPVASGGPEAAALEAVQLVPGEQVRFRRTDRARWQLGVVACLERDGSLRVTDGDGAARTVPLAFVQVKAPRSAQWEPLSERSGRAVQMQLDLGPRPRRR